MKVLETHKVPVLEKPIRLQEYGVDIFSNILTKSALKKTIKKGLITVDEKIGTTALFIRGNETIELYQSEDENCKKEFDFPLDVLFEDDYLAVIYKPAGILVSGNSFATIKNALPKNLQKSKQLKATIPQPVHRLDYPTSGVLLIGKTTDSIIKLNQLFEKKEIEKIYHAICIGEIKSEGKIDIPVDGKNAVTHFKNLQTVISQRFKYLNLVQLYPQTGRKHQLRKHLLAIKNPILGDKEHYIDDLVLSGKGLFLHASTITFIHPFTAEEIKITKELPKKFKKIFPQ